MKLADLMRKNGYSFQNLADEAKVAKGSITRSVYGQAKEPHPKTMRSIARVFNVAIEDIDEFAGFNERAQVEEIYYPEPDELAAIQTAIAASEAEKASGFTLTHEQITQRVAERIAAYRMNRDQRSSA